MCMATFEEAALIFLFFQVLEIARIVIPFLIILALYYFYLYLPLYTKKIHHTRLAPGKKVITQGGLVGTLETIGNVYCVLQLEDGARACVIKSSIVEIINES